MGQAVRGKVARSLHEAGARQGLPPRRRMHALCAPRMAIPTTAPPVSASPPACSQWFFETFCGVDKDEFERTRLEALDSSAPIRARLNGYVKPYGASVCMRCGAAAPACSCCSCLLLLLLRLLLLPVLLLQRLLLPPPPLLLLVLALAGRSHRLSPCTRPCLRKIAKLQNQTYSR